MKDCKKCHNKKSWQRKRKGLIRKREKFNFVCRSCGAKKQEKDFYQKDKKSGRYDTTCKNCRKKGTKQWHEANLQASIENKKKWHEANREKMISRMKERYKERMKENPKKEKEIRRKWRQENAGKIRENNRRRYATDPNYKISCLLRSNTRRIIKRGCKKNCKTLRMLGCSVPFVREWLESQFASEMAWKNHGKFWHIDHFYPVACFVLSVSEEQNKCFHWSNLQPLTGRANLKKGCKIPSDQEQKNHENKIAEFSKEKEEKSILLSIKPSSMDRETIRISEEICSDASGPSFARDIAKLRETPKDV